MQIKIYNTIQMEEQTELIEEIHDCQWTNKGDYDYLIHQNSQNEKVVIKLNHKELVMTRFSNPKSIMRFLKGNLDFAAIPTSMGVQRLVTRTKTFQLDRDSQQLHLIYDLLTDPEADRPLASYDMRIAWGD
ncbi:hypothetical cytosolic protein [Streptococcus criceti]|uniref:DUF1934 domain-containing protein n=1 Tax=Streptococcus criceti HS-6 TaxID=873449 RepID=G5JRI5_STRCG|nr:DUF1934 domain-containing protein [Streptococcus criceti]EHI74225.1 hypothetical protein STRCR_1994 [Streptococcus criceti HS-6]SUN42922.1 hypothetical cytosolic protein [Streptococcus criceti]